MLKCVCGDVKMHAARSYLKAGLTVTGFPPHSFCEIRIIIHLAAVSYMSLIDTL